MSIFCKHNYELISETTTKSKFESSVESLSNAGTNEIKNLPAQLCCADRKHIQVFKCEKCGKIKRYVEDI